MLDWYISLKTGAGRAASTQVNEVEEDAAHLAQVSEEGEPGFGCAPFSPLVMLGI